MSSAYLLMKERVAKENQLQQGVRKIRRSLNPELLSRVDIPKYSADTPHPH